MNESKELLEATIKGLEEKMGQLNMDLKAKQQELEDAMKDSSDKNHKKYLEIRKRNLHKMNSIPVCKMKDE